MGAEQQAGIHRQIIRLTLPAIASNITVPLLGLFDTAVTGHLGEETYLAAIAVGGMMLNVIFWLCGFLRMGTTGLTAEAFGACSEAEVAKVFSRSLVMAVVIGVVVVALQCPLLSVLSALIAPGEAVGELAGKYFTICVWGAPALLAMLSVNGWFVGMQNTLWPMVISIAVNVINIVCSVTAVFVLGMGFEGVAYGTLAANWAGVALAFAAVVRFARGRRLWCGWRAVLRGGELGKFFNVSGDLFVRSACIMAVSLSVTAFGARSGDLTVAVNAVMMQFFVFFSYFMDGFAFSGEALCGKSVGARDRRGLMLAVKGILVWAGVMAVLFFVIYFAGSGIIVGWLTDVSSVRSGVDSMRLFLWLIPPVSVAAFVFDGFFIGLTSTRRMLITTLAAMAVFFAVALTGDIADPVHGNRLLWTAFLSYLLARGAGLALQLDKTVSERLPHSKSR